MADLKTNLLGFVMNSPVIGASGTVGYGVEYEELADFAKIGGISGKNDTSGIIEQCYIDNTGTGTITVKNGMVGGVTGYNKGTITMSGDKSTDYLWQLDTSC